MEGLLLDAVLRRLAARLPAERLGWRFPAPHLVALPLVPSGAIVVDLRPTHPSLRLVDVVPEGSTGPRTPFGHALVAHAGGALVDVRQAALDRRCTLLFAAGSGFVPTPEARLEVELTGRNANVVLTDAGGVILAVHREVDASMNRRRQLRPGLAYVPPPPYDKLDPRSADRGVVATVLRGRPLERAHTVVDGVGGVLAAAWAEEAGVDPATPLDGDALERALDALAALVADPEARARRRTEAREGVLPERAALLQAARRALGRRRRTASRRVDDAERALAAADDAARLRAEGDLLLAHASRLPRGADEATLEGFDGESVRLELDPREDAAGNARRRYDAARSREARAERALESGERARRELEEVDATLAGLEELDDAALRELSDEDRPRRARPGSAPAGLRVTGPHGFEVVIGRSAKENDAVTFRIARSDDLWLHAQGYRGAHVVIRGDGREIPFDTVLFAARLAAGHSEAAQSDNVAVDYTSRRHVWRTKGMPPGAVRFTQQKTVFVTPLRRGDVA